MWQDIGANMSDPAIQASIHILFTPLGLVLTFVFGRISQRYLQGCLAQFPRRSWRLTRR